MNSNCLLFSPLIIIEVAPKLQNLPPRDIPITSLDSKPAIQVYPNRTSMSPRDEWEPFLLTAILFRWNFPFFPPPSTKKTKTTITQDSILFSVSPLQSRNSPMDKQKTTGNFSRAAYWRTEILSHVHNLVTRLDLLSTLWQETVPGFYPTNWLLFSLEETPKMWSSRHLKSERHLAARLPFGRDRTPTRGMRSTSPRR